MKLQVCFLESHQNDKPPAGDLRCVITNPVVAHTKGRERLRSRFQDCWWGSVLQTFKSIQASDWFTGAAR